MENIIAIVNSVVANVNAVVSPELAVVVAAVLASAVVVSLFYRPIVTLLKASFVASVLMAGVAGWVVVAAEAIKALGM